MIKIILERIDKIKYDEENFKSEWWKNNYVSYCTMPPTDINYDDYDGQDFLNLFMKTEHLSIIDFNNVNDVDLIRIFEYIIRCQEEISINRIKKLYFS